MDLAILREILQGGMDKISEAGVALLGGHSIDDREIKYGLSVTGFVHPSHILTKAGLKSGDSLILTKPLGTGIISTAAKAGLVPGDRYREITELMAELNRTAAGIMAEYDIHACTDITGFGLLGHLAEMVAGSGVGVRLFSDRIPVIQEALSFADMGFLPTAAYANRQFRASMISFSPAVHRRIQDVLFDPQTSGGLLIAVKEDQADSLADDLHNNGVMHAARIGEIVSGTDEKIHVV